MVMGELIQLRRREQMTKAQLVRECRLAEMVCEQTISYMQGINHELAVYDINDVFPDGGA